MGLQPVPERQQPQHGGAELGHVLLTRAALAGQPDTRGDLLLVDVQRCRTFNDRLHLTSQPLIDRTVAQGPQELASLTSVLVATIRSPGETHTPN